MKLKLIGYRKNFLYIFTIVIILVMIAFIFSEAFHFRPDLRELPLSIASEILGDAHWYIDNLGSLGYFILLDKHIISLNQPLLLILFTLLIGGALMESIHQLTIYRNRRDEKASLYLGMFFLMIIIKFIISGEVFFNQQSKLITNRAFSMVYCITYSTYISLFITYVSELSPRVSSKRLLKINNYIPWAYIFLFSFAPLWYYSYFFFTNLIISNLILINLLVALTINLFKYKKQVLYPWIMSIIMLASSVLDISFKYFYHHKSYFTYLGVLVFLFTETYLTAVRTTDNLKNNEKLWDRLQRNNLLKDEFLSHIAKELKSPMSSIIGLTEAIVSDSTPLSSEQLLNTRLINYSAVQLVHLIDDLADYSKLNGGGIVLFKSSVNMKQLVDIVILITESSVDNKKVKIINEIPEDFPLVYGDINRLQQIVSNLFEASIKTLSSGSITISGKEEKDYLQIKLMDNGSGLPFWKLNNLFNLYFIKDKEDEAFSNLSLHLTKKLIELHDGTISVSSALGEGTAFTITLPKVKVKPETLGPSKGLGFQGLIDNHPIIDEAAIYSLNKLINHKILIVDNDRAARRLMENHLTSEGYNVIGVSRGKEAISVIDNILDIDLVLINLFAPDISGIDLCTYIRQNKTPYELPILMLTSSVKSEELVLSFGAGANDYLIRPVEKTELLARVRTLLSLKEYYHENSELNNRINTTAKKLADLTDDINRVKEMDMLKTEFFSNISHELKTPLNVIWTSVQLLKSLDVNDSSCTCLSKYLPIMNQNCLRLIRLINNIIDITKIDGEFLQMDMSNEDIIFVVEEIVQSVVSYGESQGLQIIFDTETEEKIMAFDKEKIERIILNLLSNAIKFTPRGGRIDVIMRDTGDNIEIIVKDSGIGIPANKLDVIFDRFAQVDKSLSRKREGSGIGLSLVKSLVELHEGTIRAESSYGKGSSFIITLPGKIIETVESSLYDKLLPNSNKIDKINIEFSDIYSY